ncbi:MAG: hypothetical protein ABIX46_07055 [Burkholderiaceae bacterium]
MRNKVRAGVAAGWADRALADRADTRCCALASSAISTQEAVRRPRSIELTNGLVETTGTLSVSVR